MLFRAARVTAKRGHYRLMTAALLAQHLYEFAVELRRLAYTMPGGYEDRLIHLSERMVLCATEQSAEGVS